VKEKREERGRDSKRSRILPVRRVNAQEKPAPYNRASGMFANRRRDADKASSSRRRALARNKGAPSRPSLRRYGQQGKIEEVVKLLAAARRSCRRTCALPKQLFEASSSQRDMAKVKALIQQAREPRKPKEVKQSRCRALARDCADDEAANKKKKKKNKKKKKKNKKKTNKKKKNTKKKKQPKPKKKKNKKKKKKKKKTKKKKTNTQHQTKKTKKQKTQKNTKKKTQGIGGRSPYGLGLEAARTARERSGSEQRGHGAGPAARVKHAKRSARDEIRTRENRRAPSSEAGSNFARPAVRRSEVSAGRGRPKPIRPGFAWTMHRRKRARKNVGLERAERRRRDARLVVARERAGSGDCAQKRTRSDREYGHRAEPPPLGDRGNLMSPQEDLLGLVGGTMS